MKRRRTISIIAAWIGLVLFVPLWWIAVFRYANWYDDTAPVAFVPDGARLLAREPESHLFHSAIARYWYYAKYSTQLPYAEVVAFYEKSGDNARPFGYFSADILPPLSNPTKGTYNSQLPPAERRDVTDPREETIILIEVSWEPLDQTLFFPAAFCCLPVLWLGLLVFLAVGSVKHVRSMQGFQL